MEVTHHNLSHIVIAGLVIALLAFLLAWRCQGALPRLLLLAVSLILFVPTAILGVGMNPWLVDARFREYKLFYWSIEHGMSREEVVKNLDQRYPADGPRLRPTLLQDSATRLEFSMNPENTPEPDRETITLEMDTGKVTGKKYHADR